MPHEHWRRWPILWRAAADAVRARGGVVDGPHLAPPATLDEVREAEARLGRPLPASLRTVFLSLSGRISFSWRLSKELAPPPIDRVVAGGLTLDVDEPLQGLELEDADGDARVVRRDGRRALLLGETVADWLDRWTLVACAAELAPFRTRVADLDPFSDEAILWRRWLGLKVLS